MEIFFGTDGWRALLDSQINEESVAVVAQAFSDFIKKGILSVWKKARRSPQYRIILF